MDYFSLLNLTKEPFSNSPDPEMFFNSVQHQSCLQKLEISIRLKRGLCVVTGDIGTGKSTLCRQLLRKIDKKESPIIIHLILDPEFTSANEFLQTIMKTFHIPDNGDLSDWQMKEAIKNYLFCQGVDQGKIPALIIDEGQKLPDSCVEVLREFLNYETNQHKLLQIIIFAQQEFQATLKEKPNFADRITTYQKIVPLNFNETKKMIHFRVTQCRSGGKTPELFSPAALMAIYLISRGYPRRIVMLCSKVILAMLVKNTKKVGALQVYLCSRETSMPLLSQTTRLKPALILLLLILTVSSWIFLSSPERKSTRKAAAPETADTNQVPAFLKKKDIPTNFMTQIKEVTTNLNFTKKSENKLEVVSKKLDVVSEYSRSSSYRRTVHPLLKDAPPSLTNLGSLPIEGGETLSGIMSLIYGKYTVERLNEVLSKNPHITSPHEIPEHTLVTLPYFPDKKSLKSTDLSVVLLETDSLQEASSFIKEYRQPPLPTVHVAPLQIAPGNVTLQVQFKDTFDNAESASKAISVLPENYRLMARIKPAKQITGEPPKS